MKKHSKKKRIEQEIYDIKKVFPPDGIEVIMIEELQGYSRPGYLNWLYRDIDGNIAMPARHGKGMLVRFWKYKEK